MNPPFLLSVTVPLSYLDISGGLPLCDRLRGQHPAAAQHRRRPRRASIERSDRGQCAVSLGAFAVQDSVMARPAFKRMVDAIRPPAY